MVSDWCADCMCQPSQFSLPSFGVLLVSIFPIFLLIYYYVTTPIFNMLMVQRI